MSRQNLEANLLAGRVPSDTRVFQQIAEFYNYEWFIVTAAVYGCFGCQLHLTRRLTASLDIPAPGRRHTVYVLLRVSTVLCF